MAKRLSIIIFSGVLLFGYNNNIKFWKKATHVRIFYRLRLKVQYVFVIIFRKVAGNIKKIRKNLLC